MPEGPNKHAWKRPIDAGSRPSYVARSRVERFIVPLLAEAIPAAIDRHIRPLAPGKVLDVGCGRQPFRGLLQSAGLRYVGMDAAQNKDGNVEFIGVIDGVLPDGLERGFDAVVCTEVLEHVADWEAAFANFAALLRPGGRLLATCPAAYPPHEEPYDFWRPTTHALRFYAERHGLKVVELSRLGSGLDVVGTTLLATRPRARVPVVGHVWAMVMQMTRSIAAGVLAGRVSRALARDAGTVYHSNLVVLEKA